MYVCVNWSTLMDSITTLSIIINHVADAQSGKAKRVRVFRNNIGIEDQNKESQTEHVLFISIMVFDMRYAYWPKAALFKCASFRFLLVFA